MAAGAVMPPEQGPGSRAYAMRAHAPALILLVAIAGGIFINALGSEFVWSDNPIIVHNEHIRRLANVGQFFRPAYWKDVRADPFGIRTRGFHATSILIHVATTLLVYFLACRILPDRASATFCAVLFAAHAVHVEAVVYTKARPSLMLALFMVASTLLFVRWVHAPPAARAAHLLPLGVVAYAAALLSKISAVVLPAVLLVYLLWLAPRQRRRRGLMAIVSFVGLAAMFLALEATMPTPTWPHPPVTIYKHALAIVSTLGFYTRLLVLPVGLCLNHHMDLPTGISDPQVLRTLPWLVGLLVATVIAFGACKPAFFGLAWILICMGPISNVVFLGRWIGEMRAYSLSVGYCLVVGLLLGKLSALGSSASARRRARAVALGLCTAIVAVYVGVTVDRNRDWADNMTLWTDTAQKNPKSWPAHHGLARAYYLEGEVEKTIVEFKKVLELKPDDTLALEELAVIFDETGQYGEAIKCYTWLLELDAQDVRARVGLGVDYLRTGAMPEALGQFEAAARLEPDSVFLRYMLGTAYEESGAPQRALQQYREAIRLRPDDAETWFAMGLCLERMGDEAEAARCYRKCLQVGGAAAPQAQRRLQALAGSKATAP
jgi:Flp pilus assembly protein TadD